MVAPVLEDPVPVEALRSVLVIKLRHLGDVLLAAPVFSVLKSRAPRAEIDALVYSESAPMLSGHPAIRKVHCIERSWRQLGSLARMRAEWRLLAELRERRYDLVVHLTEHWRGAWLTMALGPRWSVAPAVRGRSGLWRRRFTHLFSAPPFGRHVVERNLDALRRIGIYPELAERGLTLVAGAAAEQKVDALLASHGVQGSRFVQIHPSSRWRFKCWPADKMAALVERLQAEGWQVVLTAAPDAVEAELIADITRRLARPVAANLAGQLTLKELAALTARARLFVGVDSAPMHIAAAVGTPALAIFGPSGEALWAPWGVPRLGTHRVVASEGYSCRPCGLDGCGGGKVSDCLATLEVARVWNAAREMLESK